MNLKVCNHLNQKNDPIIDFFYYMIEGYCGGTTI